VKRIYIAGPMTGIEDLNRAEFEKAEGFIWQSSAGTSLSVNPHVLAEIECWDEKTPLCQIASILLGDLVGCDAIYMLRGWRDSKGATAEHAVAKWIGLEIIYQGEAE